MKNLVWRTLNISVMFYKKRKNTNVQNQYIPQKVTSTISYSADCVKMEPNNFYITQYACRKYYNASNIKYLQTMYDWQNKLIKLKALRHLTLIPHLVRNIKCPTSPRGRL